VPLLFGAKAVAIAPLLTPYVAALGFFTLSSVITSYYLAKKQYIFPIASLCLSLAMASGIWVWHRDTAQVAQVLFMVSSFGLSFFLALHFALQHLKVLRSNLRDFVDVFLSIPDCGLKLPGTKRILMFNWRDTKHTYAGGAEVYVHEIAKQWVASGHQVMLFAGNDGKAPRNETLDGVHIIRRGGFYFVYVWAAVYYILRLRRCDFDVIIDCQNGIPFFTPLYSRRPVYCLMHHVHQQVFTRSLTKPLAWFARFLEKDLMPIVYRHVPFITVSESSKIDIENLGLGQAGVEVVHPGVDLRELEPGEKHPTPLVLYLGRLKAYKSIDVLIRAFAQVLFHVPEAQLVIAGSGEEEQSLRQLVSELALEERITFAGRVTASEKVSLLQRAWLFVNPSFMEGWGITTIEANACATPVVASNVPGLRDSVRNPHTGYLVEHGNVEKFAERMLDILGDRGLRQRMSVEAIAWAGQFDWSNSSKKFLSIIQNEIDH
jgi:glycosyltransferase involved in cell wall biosynthesis